jgi:hypothetical protein
MKACTESWALSRLERVKDIAVSEAGLAFWKVGWKDFELRAFHLERAARDGVVIRLRWLSSASWLHGPRSFWFCTGVVIRGREAGE